MAPERLEALVEWAEAHSPVGDALGRVVAYEIEIEVVRAPSPRPESSVEDPDE